MTTSANIVTGTGESSIARDIYAIDALRVIDTLRRERKYVCMANVMARMPKYNQGILWSVLWALAMEGKLQ